MNVFSRTTLAAIIAAQFAGVSLQFPTMKVGINTTWLQTYSGTPFANVLYNFGEWSRVSGTSTIVSQNQGSLVLTGGAATDVYRLNGIPGPGTSLKGGTYTIINPDGLNIGIGTNGGPTGYSTATRQSISFSNVTNGIFLYYKGNTGVTNINGPVCVIMPGAITSWDAGDIFNPDYISYMQGLGVQQIRFMDAMFTNTSLATDWSDRIQPTGITLCSHQLNSLQWAHEHVIALANRLGIEPWVCFPARATIGTPSDTSTYAYQMATLYKNTLNSGIKLQLEYVNEVWNSATPFTENWGWVTKLQYTKYLAAANPSPANSYTKVGHGLPDGQHVYCFSTKENAPVGYGNQPAQMSYQISSGGECIVSVLDADTFQLKTTLPGNAILQVALQQKNLMFALATEAGKNPSNATQTNYANQLVALWNVFDAVLGAGRYMHRVGGQGGNSAVAYNVFTTLAAAGAANRADRCHIAPYFNGLWWNARIAPAAGQITPGLWTSSAGTVTMALYAAGATPSTLDVLAGTGAINQQVISTPQGGTVYTDFAPVTGLTDGTSYQIFFLFGDTSVMPWVIKGTVQSGTGSMSYIYESTDGTLTGSFPQQAKRGRLSATANANGLTTHSNLANITCPVDVYECGYDFVAAFAPAEQALFTSAYLKSPEAGQALKEHFLALASHGARSANQYADMLGTVYNLSTPPSNYLVGTSDPKYVALSSFGGSVQDHGLIASAIDTTVPLMAAIVLPDMSAPDVTTLPTFPAPVATLPAGFNYAIYSGNLLGNFDISGNTLRLVAANGVDFAHPAVSTVRVEGTDGYTFGYFNVKLFLGSSWFKSSSVWASTPLHDVSNISVTSQIVPEPNGFGTALALQTNATNAVSTGDGMYDMTGAAYFSGSAMNTSMKTDKPIFIAMVVDRFNHVAGFGNAICFSIGSNLIGWNFSASVNAPRWQLQLNAATAATSNSMPPASSAWVSGQKHVQWLIIDAPGGMIYSGYDQNVVSTAALSVATNLVFSSTIILGNNATTLGVGVQTLLKAKLGAIQVTYDSALTLTSGLAAVQQMQNLYGI